MCSLVKAIIREEKDYSNLMQTFIHVTLLLNFFIRVIWGPGAYPRELGEGHPGLRCKPTAEQTHTHVYKYTVYTYTASNLKHHSSYNTSRGNPQSTGTTYIKAEAETRTMVV